jgi:hypothetical protein
VGRAVLILDLGIRWDERSASRPGRAIAPGKGPPVPTVQEAAWAPESVWIQRLEEKLFRLCRESNLDRPVVQPVSRHYWLSYCGSPIRILLHEIIVHRPRVDPRKECESCGNARLRKRKWCSLLSNVKAFAPQRKKWARLLKSLNCSMFAVRLLITTSRYRWPIRSLPSICMFCTPLTVHQGRLHPAGINSCSVDSN